MSGRAARFEVVRSDAGWFARVRGANGRKVWQSEVYTRMESALNAFRVLGDLFGVRRAYVTNTTLQVCTFDGPASLGRLSLPIHHIDERSKP